MRFSEMKNSSTGRFSLDTYSLMSTCNQEHEQKTKISVKRSKGDLVLGRTVDASRQLQRAATLLHCPTTLEVLQHSKYGVLKYIYATLIVLISAILFSEVVTITTDLFQEKLGTRTTFRTIEAGFAQKYFKTIVCPHDWLSRSRVENLELDVGMLRYLLGYLFQVEDVDLDPDFPKRTLAEARITTKAVRKVNQLIRDSGGLSNVFRAVMKDFGSVFTNETILLFGNGPDGFMPCFDFKSYHIVDLIGDVDLDYGDKSIQFQLNDSIPQSEIKRRTVGPRATHYHSSRFAVLNTGRLHFYSINYPNNNIMIQLRHFQRYSGGKHTCKPTNKGDLTPFGFAKHVCAYQCWHDIIYKHFNCSFLALVDPIHAPRNAVPCNVLENEMFFKLGIYAPEAVKCANVRKCRDMNYCNEYDIKSQVLEVGGSCEGEGRYHCESVKMFGFIHGNEEKITDYPLRTLSNVLSDYGGQIGLWVGVSILGITQVCCHKCWYWYTFRDQYRLKRKNKAKLAKIRANGPNRLSVVIPAASSVVKLMTVGMQEAERDPGFHSLVKLFHLK